MVLERHPGWVETDYGRHFRYFQRFVAQRRRTGDAYARPPLPVARPLLVTSQQPFVPPIGAAAELMRDHRARMIFARDQAVARRKRAIEDQRCDSLTATERVSMWENLHQVRLPTDPDHQILILIAQQTELRLDEVRDVQRNRTIA